MKSKLEKFGTVSIVSLIVAGTTLRAFSSPQCDGEQVEDCPSTSCTWNAVREKYVGCEGFGAKKFTLGGDTAENTSLGCGFELVGDDIQSCESSNSDVACGPTVGNMPVCDDDGGE